MMDAKDATIPGGAAAQDRRPDPKVRAATIADIGEALAEGMRDFQAAPLYGLFFGGVYALGGVAMTLAATAWGMIYLVYPLAAGFALIGPFVAVGLYEVSRRREKGEALGWGPVLGVVFAQSRRELGWMAFVTLFIFMMWMYQVRLLIALFFGFQSFAPADLFRMLLTTPEGWLFLGIGHLVGAILSVILYSVTVVSFPLLLDREVDFITAMITSVRAVTMSPGPMLGWAAIVVCVLLVACAPMFLGLFVALPILGHTTWRLYRRLIVDVPPGGSVGG
jgi:uncharacterized membrane protein